MKMNKAKKELRKLCLCAMLLAMSIAIGYLCKSIFASVDGLFRISFDTLPVIIVAVLFGPVWGGVIGACSDLLTYVITPQAFAPIPLVTVGYAMIGVVAGIVAKYVVKKTGNLQIILAGGLGHLVGSMICKVIGLYSIYGWLVLVRIPIYLIVGAIEIFLICLLFKNKTFRRSVQEFGI